MRYPLLKAGIRKIAMLVPAPLLAATAVTITLASDHQDTPEARAGAVSRRHDSSRAASVRQHWSPVARCLL